jgi:hypothetical protein
VRKTIVVIVLLVAATALAEGRHDTPVGTVRDLLSSRIQYLEAEDISQFEKMQLVVSCFDWENICASDPACDGWSSLDENGRAAFIVNWFSQNRFFDPHIGYRPPSMEFESSVALHDGAGFESTVTVVWTSGVMTFDVHLVDDVFLIKGVAWG